MSRSQSKKQAESADLDETVVPGKGVSADTRPVGSNAEPSEASTSQPSPSSKSPSAKKKSASKTYRLGDFELRKELGQGGMGKVFLAHQISLDRICALKVMSGELAKKPGFVDRFVREARSMAKIDHPHVVKCYAVGEDRGKHFVAMELIDGQSMQDWLDDLGTLSVEDALHVILLCADALQHAHGLNMIHRDIKPDNVLVTKNGLVKVADLGLAKALDDDMSMTQSGTGLGTPQYMPPEQARDAKHVDARCDIYALGCTLYHFVTGQLPFAGDSVVELITNKEKGRFTPARRINSQIPERLDLMIDKMMAKDPKHRYASCSQVIRDLEALNLAGELLSFIDSEQKAVMRRGGGVSTSPDAATQQALPGTKRKKPQPASPSPAAERRSSASATAAEWYVRYPSTSGRIKVSKMSEAQILQALKGGKLDLRTRVARQAKGDFVPVAQIPVFEDEAVTRTRVQQKHASMANAYAKIEKQYKRQRWWRLIARFRDGTLNLVGLAIWLLVVAAAAVGLFLAVQYGYQYIGNSLDL